MKINIFRKLVALGVLLLSAITIILFMPFVQATGENGNNNISTEVIKTSYESNDIFYSDSYFAHSSTEYDSHLATLSIYMAKFSMNPGNPSSADDTDWYLKQSNRVKEFFGKIGFGDFIANEDYKTRTRFDTIGLAIAKKQIGDYTVLGIAVRSGGYFFEWSNNVYLGNGTKSDYMHEGWYNAANKLIKFLRSYIEETNVTGKIKLWMAGYSRGGAVTNVAAGLIDNKLNDKSFISNKISLAHDDLYAYTFEAPQGANVNSKTVEYPRNDLYNNIFNVVNPNDLVTKVAMSDYGFTRFGIDKIITTQFFDPENFNNNRASLKLIYEANHGTYNVHPDNFKMYGISGGKMAILVGSFALGYVSGAAITGFVMEKLVGIISDDNSKGNYDSNIVTSMILHEICQAVGSRQNYCEKYQDALRDFMKVLMSDVGTTKGRIKDMLIGLSVVTIARAVGMPEKAVDILKLMFPSVGQIDITTIASLAATLAQVYSNKPNELISIIKNIEDMFDNHSTDLNISHIKLQDSYFIDDYNKNHETKAILVPLRENADIIHISFYGFNDLQVYMNSSKDASINIEGHVLGNSDLKKCAGGLAAGYYSYATEERMELFVPVKNTFKISTKSYSKKPYHEVTFNSSLMQNSLGKAASYNLPSYNGKFWFNSDRIEKTIVA